MYPIIMFLVAGHSVQFNFLGPKEYLIFANRKDVRKMSTDAMQFDEFVSDQKGAVGVAYDSLENYIYWTDVKEKAIKRILLNSSHGKQPKLITN